MMQYAVKDASGRVKLLIHYRDVTGFVCRDDHWIVQVYLCGGQTVDLSHDSEEERNDTAALMIDGIQNDELSAS